ncbi:MAG: histidine phosphatase family protein [Rhodobacteraceae bacterium]|nr:histidine phosphatase family protein [Paracoccaceae bacterium]MCY4197567.1 histidine phosphatase family protein [Paracoccaceae bacterium]MCY4326554.1 histidine phosphatase family protein [Paracoccaceae bacterium]
MKLIIVRHAKSSWNQPEVGDHHRPLAARGRKAATRIGQWLADDGHIPASVLCSTATRTRQTWECLSSHFPNTPKIRLTDQLYHASVRQIWAVLQNDGSVDLPTLIIGHNPGIGEFAASCLQAPPRDYDFRRYPTAATTVCTFPATGWQQVSMQSGQLMAFVVPRKLA